MKLQRVIAYVALGLLILYGGYVYGAYRYLSSRHFVLLVDYCVFPQDLPRGWRLLVFPRSMCKHVLMSTSPGEVVKEFTQFRVTLYSGVLGYSNDRFPPVHRTSEKTERLLQEITAFVYRSGVGADLRWVDSIGCTAIHQALIERDQVAAEYLLSLTNVSVELKNPAAGVKDCQMTVASLAAAKGVRLERR